ncbi:uncharacterized protein ACNFOS_014551 [Eudromia elegans]
MAAEREGEEEGELPVPESGAVFTFGKSTFAENIPSKFWFKNDKPVHISCGDEHTAIVTGNGKLYMFGSNNWGQLGLGSKNTVSKPTCVKALKPEKTKLAACGRNHTLVYTEKGNVYAAGGNSEGQLGLGDTEERTTFHVISFFTNQHKIKQLAAGSYTSAAITEDGQLFMWGDNSEGQIGLDNEPCVCVPCQVVVGKPVSSVSCGYYHSALITGDGELYTFGEPENGKLGLLPEQLKNSRVPQPVPGIMEKVNKVACGGGHTVVLTERDVYTFGVGQYGQLGHGTFLFETSVPKCVEHLRRHKIRSIACGENHTAVIAENGLMFTFGDGRHGKLGLGEENFVNQFEPILCSNFLRFTVLLVACGGCHMLVFAAPRPKGSEEILIEDVYANSLTATTSGMSIVSSATSTLKKTLSARMRRRAKEGSPEQFIRMIQTLPPLGENFLKSSLHVTNNTSLPYFSATDLPGVKPTELDYETEKNHRKDKLRDGSEEEDSDDESNHRNLGDTSDILNVTHMMKLNPSDQSLKLSPIQKQKKNNKNVKLKRDGKGRVKNVDSKFMQECSKSDSGSLQKQSSLSESLEQYSDLEKNSAFVGKPMTAPKNMKGKHDQAQSAALKTGYSSNKKSKVVKSEHAVKTVILPSVRVDQPQTRSLVVQKYRPVRKSGSKEAVACENKMKDGTEKADKYERMCVREEESNEQQSEFKKREKFLKQIAVSMSSSSSEESSSKHSKYMLKSRYKKEDYYEGENTQKTTKAVENVKDLDVQEEGCETEEKQATNSEKECVETDIKSLHEEETNSEVKSDEGRQVEVMNEEKTNQEEESENSAKAESEKEKLDEKLDSEVEIVEEGESENKNHADRDISEESDEDKTEKDSGEENERDESQVERHRENEDAEEVEESPQEGYGKEQVDEEGRFIEEEGILNQAEEGFEEEESAEEEQMEKEKEEQVRSEGRDESEKGEKEAEDESEEGRDNREQEEEKETEAEQESESEKEDEEEREEREDEGGKAGEEEELEEALEEREEEEEEEEREEEEVEEEVEEGEEEEEREKEEEGEEEEEREEEEVEEEVEEEGEEEEEEEEGEEEDEKEQEGEEEEEEEEGEEVEEGEEEEGEEEGEEEVEEEEGEEEEEEEGEEEEEEEEEEGEEEEEEEEAEEEEEEKEDEEEKKGEEEQEEEEDKSRHKKQVDSNKYTQKKSQNSRKPKKTGSTAVPNSSIQKMKSKHSVANGLHNPEQFWNNVLPHYLTLK